MRRSLFRFLPLLGLFAVAALGMNGGLAQFGLGEPSGTEQVAATSYNAMSVTLKNGSRQVVRWDGCQDVVTYKVNLSGVGAGKKAGTLRTVRQAFTRLGAVNGMSYRYAGQTGFVPTKSGMQGSPAEIVVAAIDPGQTDFAFEGDTLGVGGVLWNSWKTADGESGVAAVRGYVLLNAASLPDLKAGFGNGHTVGNLVLHELGQVMGLEHVASTKNLMDADLTDASPNGFGPGDQRGLQALGAGAGCIDIPASALADLN